MTFSVNINGSPLTDGKAVFPFSFGKLLDERLDEAYLHITQSATPVYKPTTPVQVVVSEAGDLTTFDYVVASDNAYELPVGSGKYRHDIHLIETTKMLEGIYCQSITFTNSIGNNYLGAAALAEPYNIPGDYTYVNNPIPLTKNYNKTNLRLFQTPAAPLTSITIPSLRSVAEMLSDLSIERSDANGGQQTQIHIANGNESETITNFDEVRTISVSNSVTIEYTVFASLPAMDPDLGTVKTYAGYKFSYTIMTAENTLPLEPLTVKECINRVLDLAEPRFGYASKDAPRFHLNETQATEFDKILAPEFSMTQCTLREQLKVIGGFIHGEPRLRPNGEIYYDMYGDTEESAEITASTPYVYRGMTHDIAQYCTQVDTTASNIVNALNYAQGVVFSPNSTNFKTIRTETVNVRVTEDNGFIDTDFNIQDVVKTECVVFGEDGKTAIDLCDITPYVFTESAYNAHLSTYGGGYPRAKSYGIYYGIGKKGIRGLFFKEQSANLTLHPYLEYYAIVNIIAAASGMTPNAVRSLINGDYTRIAFRISYIPIYNTRFSHGKQTIEAGEEYTQIYNQSENLIETRYFGENVKGVAARLGNVEQTRTYFFKNLSQIPNVGHMVNVGTEESPEYYAISAVNTEAMPFYYKTTVALTKDFNRISEYVGISSNKRVYEVSEREAYLRNILLKEYAIVGKDAEYSKGIFQDPVGVASAFNPSIGDGEGKTASPISSVWAWGGTHENPYQAGLQTGKSPLPLVALPVVSSSFGNSLVFSWGYKDNYSAGVRITEEINVGQVKGRWQQDVEYCDAYGRMYFYNFFLLGKNEETELGNDFALASPFVPVGDYSKSRAKSKIKTEPTKSYRIRKDSREIINFNFELEFKTNCKNLIIGSGLASACKLVSEGVGGYAVIYRFTGEYGKVGKFDRQFIPQPGVNGSHIPGMQVSVENGKVIIPLPEDTQYAKHWVITTPYKAGEPYEVEDEEGNKKTITPDTGGEILLSCSDPYALYQELGKNNTIYINLAKELPR